MMYGESSKPMTPDMVEVIFDVQGFAIHDGHFEPLEFALCSRKMSYHGYVSSGRILRSKHQSLRYETLHTHGLTHMSCSDLQLLTREQFSDFLQDISIDIIRREKLIGVVSEKARGILNDLGIPCLDLTLHCVTYNLEQLKSDNLYQPCCCHMPLVATAEKPNCSLAICRIVMNAL